MPYKIIIIFRSQKNNHFMRASNSKLPDLSQYDLNKFSLKRFVEFAAVDGQLIEMKNKKINNERNEKLRAFFIPQ